jgi:hypothetical protein
VLGGRGEEERGGVFGACPLPEELRELFGILKCKASTIALVSTTGAE